MKKLRHCHPMYAGQVTVAMSSLTATGRVSAPVALYTEFTRTHQEMR